MVSFFRKAIFLLKLFLTFVVKDVKENHYNDSNPIPFDTRAIQEHNILQHTLKAMMNNKIDNTTKLSSFNLSSFKNSILDCKPCLILWLKITWFDVISFIRLFLPTTINVWTNSCIFCISRSKNFLCLCDDNDFGVVVSKQSNLNRHFLKWRSLFCAFIIILYQFFGWMWW